MKVRLAEIRDLEIILSIYEKARQFMRANGNPSQWHSGHPKEELLLADIQKQDLYVIYEKDKIYGVFALIYGVDPTYRKIYDGAWLNDNDYATIHRIASSGEKAGILTCAIDYAKSKINNVRIDTHQNNLIMQHLILKNQFQYCGIIKLADGDKRLAYHFEK